jgi:prepilin-type processing-associated H-X9-DG protein
LTSEVFVCPSSNDERSPGGTPQEAAQHLSEPGHLSYAYVAAGMAASTSEEFVLLHDRPPSHNGDGITVLFADGHAEFHGRGGMKWILDELAAGHNPPRRAGPK